MIYSRALAGRNSSKIKGSTLPSSTLNSQMNAWTNSRNSRGLLAKRLVEKELTQTPNSRQMSTHSKISVFGFLWKRTPRWTAPQHQIHHHRHCRRHGSHRILNRPHLLRHRSWRRINQHRGAKTKHTLRTQQSPARLKSIVRD